jgi:hypothetical protein
VVAHQHDPRRAEERGRAGRADAHRPVAEHRDGVAGLHAGVHHAVVAGGEDVAQRQHLEVVLVAGQRLGDHHQGAVGLGDAHELALAALHLAAGVLAPEGAAEDAAVLTGAVEAAPAEEAVAVGEDEGRHHPVAHGQALDLRPDGLDQAHELVPQPRARLQPESVAAVVEVQVGAADAGLGDPHQSVAGLPDGGLGRPLDADVPETVVVRRPHAVSLDQSRLSEV